VLSQSNLGPRPPARLGQPPPQQQQQQQQHPQHAHAPQHHQQQQQQQQQQPQSYRISDRDIFLLRRLGQGASGTVYKALHVARKRFVAVKRVDLAERSRRQQLLNDVRALCGAPRAPGLVAFEGAYHAPGSGQISIVLEYLDGGSLADVLARLRAAAGETPGAAPPFAGGSQPAAPPPSQQSQPTLSQHAFSQPTPSRAGGVAGHDPSQQPSQQPSQSSSSFRGLPEPLLAQLARDMLRGLAALHQRRTVHRDIKPGNILLSLSTGEAKITDFGISAFAVDSTLAACETFTGTVTYMSPERVESRPYGFAADVWSLGLVLLECATGRYPYDASAGPLQLMIEVVQGDPPLPDVRGKGGGGGSQQAGGLAQDAPFSPGDDGERWGSGGGGGGSGGGISGGGVQLAGQMQKQQQQQQREAAAGQAGGGAGGGGSGSSAPHQRGVSAELRDLLARCLDKDPARRPSAAALLEHPFLVKHGWGPGGNGRPALAGAGAARGAGGGGGGMAVDGAEDDHGADDDDDDDDDGMRELARRWPDLRAFMADVAFDPLEKLDEIALVFAFSYYELLTQAAEAEARAAAEAAGVAGAGAAANAAAAAPTAACVRQLESLYTSASVLSHDGAVARGRAAIAARLRAAASAASAAVSPPSAAAAADEGRPPLLCYRPLSVDCQPLGVDGSALVHVMGAISRGGGEGAAGGGGAAAADTAGCSPSASAPPSSAAFAETFILAQSAPGEYYVANQCFRVLR
jgi:serine/threonine protein kinase